ncbi:MAG TPA: acyl carrier protein [Rhodobiaceae bacterium]|nr:acyl carrier protein [Rhodobiaceae bacterium]|tara:strand:- start:8573 stop:8821 length:249 start_codon:yes stop_codon:yes gene_type:complete
MNLREEIFERLKAILVESFELDPSTIVEEADLYEDLDIDSIDAVDLMIGLKDLTGKKIEPDDFKKVRTIGDVLDALHQLVNA